MFPNQYFGNNYFYDFYWGPNVVTGGTTGKEFPAKFLEYLFKRGKVEEEEKEVLEVLEPQFKEDFEYFEFNYLEFISLIRDVPEYEQGVIKTQEEKFFRKIDGKLKKLREKVSESGVTLELIIGLLASELDELEIGLVLSQCLKN